MAGGFTSNISAKAKEVMKEEYCKATEFLSDATKSRAYLYPFKGIIYFVTHKSLWKPFSSRILPTLGLTIGVFASMLFFTYVPQLAILVFINGPLAIFTTILLILNESSIIINIFSRNFLLRDALLDAFDGTLIARNAINIVKEGRQLKSGNDPVSRLGKILKSPFSKFTPKALIRYVMYLPLNFIPVIGTIIFLFFQGRSRGSVVHDRYFQLKGWPSPQQQDWLKRYTSPYTTFGTVATLLEMIPVLSIFFTITNAVGAALWAADIEQGKTQMIQGTAGNLRETAKKAE
ncbi:uncharacterized protein GGS22DRAFT_159835 [Annulohypoxylon maeteangense]|uniref:uncharacterized protein n=1 Tax=Annulohypoxylon maeteangense TaxID=1927788 RepID=UPI002008199A|nr:uncharacterized protein GGS22DRAFT_159835 [Annulohypoxylon maeteangense]KAI0886078.1 hypothetical protein GGS22DRAFT_159835 [Annulohypoxylon maeteangense]